MSYITAACGDHPASIVSTYLVPMVTPSLSVSRATTRGGNVEPRVYENLYLTILPFPSSSFANTHLKVLLTFPCSVKSGIILIVKSPTIHMWPVSLAEPIGDQHVVQKGLQ